MWNRLYRRVWLQYPAIDHFKLLLILGCSVYSEKVHGLFRNPQIEKESLFKSIAGSVLNPLEDAWEFIQGEECAVFYSGSVAQPEG